MRMRNNMFRRLPVEQATGRLYGGRHRLRVVYRTRDLVVLGLGVMIGSGIFKIAGEQATATAGPGVLVSFLIAGGVCLLVALALAELSSIIPVAGSAYSFSYVAFGEVWAWIVGWALVMELLLATAVLARVWSLYATQALADFDVPVPAWLGDLIGQEKGPDLFALGILLLVIGMLATGSRLSLKTLWFMVMAKVIVIGLVIATGLKFFSPGNLTPFVPPSQPAPEGDQTMLDAMLGALGGGTPEVFGVWGLFAAAPAIAFAYIGFDLIATSAEETDDAPRKVPRGILTALITAVVLYAAVAVALVGMVGMDGFAKLNPDKLLIAAAFDSVGAGAMGKLVDVGVVLALTTVILVLVISLTRVVFSMSRDGLLPRPLAHMSRRYKVPSRATLLSGGVALVISQTLDVLTLEQLVVIGTLFAFLFVPAAVVALRHTRPDLHRPFRVPLAPVTAVVTVVAVGWLMLNLKVQTWAYFGIWMVVGLLLYLAYGRRKSQMKLLLDEPPPERPAAARLTAPPPGVPMLPAPPPPGAGQVSPYPPGGGRAGAPTGEYPGQQTSGGWPSEQRPGPPESPYPTGRYSSGRHSTGQFSWESDADPQESPPPYTPGSGASGGYENRDTRDTSTDLFGGSNPFASGEYPAGPYDSGAHPSGSSSSSGPYDSGPYDSGRSDSGPYPSGPYSSGPYSSDPYDADPYGSGPYQQDRRESGRPRDGEHDEPPPHGGRHRR
ncbi:APC family permease [Actinomadura soli]|uniref:APC family permease n=1 Tax=Actinomadura soli TaxID=2508997 RepID=UPI0022A6F188|nr:amino acid permease [Actinomadura soli]